jgi:O-antigen/teichoic acid export membrane protein
VSLQPKSLRGDAMLLLACGMVVRVCGLLLIVILSRVISARLIGIFSFAEAVADTLILIASFNLDSLIVRRIAAGAASEATGRFAPLMGFRIVSAPIYLLVIWIVSRFAHTEERWILPVVGLCTLLESLFFCISDIFVGISRPGFRAGIEVVAELIFTAVFVVAMLLRPTMTTLLAVSLLRGVMLFGGVLYMARTRLGPLRVGWDNSLIVAGVPFLLIAFLLILQGKIETMLLGMLSNYEAVGVFQLALRVIMAAQFIPLALGSVIYPRLAAEGLTAHNRGRLVRSVALLTGLGLFSCVFVLVFQGPLSRLLYGPAAARVAPVLMSLAPVLPIRFVALFLAAALAAVGRERSVLSGMIVGTVIGLIVDFLFIPRLGAIGASLGVIASGLCQCIQLGVVLHGSPSRQSPESICRNVDVPTVVA